MRDSQQECAALGQHRSYFSADKADFRSGHARQHFPRPHRIERGYAWIKKNRYLKWPIVLLHIVMVGLTATVYVSGHIGPLGARGAQRTGPPDELIEHRFGSPRVALRVFGLTLFVEIRPCAMEANGALHGHRV